MKANASRHKVMSYDRMLKDEERLKQEIADMMAQADSADDEQFGDRHGDEIPDELARGESRLAKIREARAALEAAARQKAAEHAAKMEAEGRDHRTAPDTAVPEDKDQWNFTDPESKIMKTSNNGFDQCGKAQIVTTEDQIIVAADVTNQANDVRHVEPMVDQLQSNIAAAKLTCGVKEFLADAGCFSEEDTKTITDAGMNPSIATQRLKHNEQILECAKGLPAGDLTPKQLMARRLRTKKGKQTYAKRKWMVEPVFGQIKACRGFRQFFLRSLNKMQGEWTIVCLTHNLLKAFNAFSSLGPARMWKAKITTANSACTAFGISDRLLPHSSSGQASVPYPHRGHAGDKHLRIK